MQKYILLKKPYPLLVVVLFSVFSCNEHRAPMVRVEDYIHMDKSTVKSAMKNAKFIASAESTLDSDPSWDPDSSFSWRYIPNRNDLEPYLGQDVEVKNIYEDINLKIVTSDGEVVLARKRYYLKSEKYLKAMFKGHAVDKLETYGNTKCRYGTITDSNYFTLDQSVLKQWKYLSRCEMAKWEAEDSIIGEYSIDLSMISNGKYEDKGKYSFSVSASERILEY